MSRALVTGATGNLGFAVVGALQPCNWEITGLSRSGYRNTTACDLGRWNATEYWASHQVGTAYDLVVFAHGVTKIKPIEKYTEVDYQHVLDVNLMGCVSLTQALLKHDLLAPNALLVFLSSIHAQTPRAERGLYAMSKAALEAFMKTFAIEYAQQYRAVALRLGQCNTFMQGLRLEDDKAYMASRLLTPLLEPAEVARFIINCYAQPGLTGQVLTYDGGQGHNVW